MKNHQNFDFQELINNILEGRRISYEEALAVHDSPDIQLPQLIDAAGKVRDKFCGTRIDLCSIVNAKSGLCEQDCRFCAQSSRNDGSADIYGMKEPEDILEHAMAAQKAGAHRFCVVTSGGRLGDMEFDKAVAAIKLIKENTGLMRCASLGRLNNGQLDRLAEAGLDRYHHNVETAADFYPSVCSTQEYAEKIETIRSVKQKGLQLCVGGIFNLGEMAEHRLRMAFEIRELEPDSVPLNFLNPRPGTPLSKQPPMDVFEAIKIIALYRLIMPEPVIRLAAGRCETLGCLQEKAAGAGINGLLIGDYLTTTGPGTKKDLAMLMKLGFNLRIND